MTQPCRAIPTNTPLPPGIRGRVLGHLILQVPTFRWTGLHPLTGVRVDGTSKSPTPPRLSVRVVWWGEQGSGVLFRPRIAHRAGHKQAAARTLAKYQVCVPVHKLLAYLSGRFFYPIFRLVFFLISAKCSTVFRHEKSLSGCFGRRKWTHYWTGSSRKPFQSG